MLGSRHSFRDINVRHPQSTAYRAGEERWVTQTPVAVLPVINVSAGAFIDTASPMDVAVFGTYFGVLVELGSLGTDSASMTAGLGNIGGYEIYNNVNNGNLSVTVFGTYFDALVNLQSIGTDSGLVFPTLFGTYWEAIHIEDVGTDTGAMAVLALGTYTLIVMSEDTGTREGALTASAFGTYLQVVAHAGTYVENVSNTTLEVFGTYTAT